MYHLKARSSFTSQFVRIFEFTTIDQLLSVPWFNFTRNCSSHKVSSNESDNGHKQTRCRALHRQRMCRAESIKALSTNLNSHVTERAEILNGNEWKTEPRRSSNGFGKKFADNKLVEEDRNSNFHRFRVVVFLIATKRHDGTTFVTCLIGLRTRH